ncbi:MAG: hypothetical protein K1X89_04045 [Myxococcaceae bacterium]|nr:hypothetical protein [Myxococcaceae bacterium]
MTTAHSTIANRAAAARAAARQADTNHDGKLSWREQQRALAQVKGAADRALRAAFAAVRHADGFVSVKGARNALVQGKRLALGADTNGNGVSRAEKGGLSNAIARALVGSTGGSAIAGAAAGAVAGSKAAAPVKGPSGAGSGPLMDRLARAGVAAANAINRPGLCARGVANALESIGLAVPRQPSAYMYGNVLARDPRFKEIHISDVSQAPPGAIVVWGATGGSSAVGQHGHIMIAQPGGGESASIVRDHRIRLSSQMRVFVPVG